MNKINSEKELILAANSITQNEIKEARVVEVFIKFIRVGEIDTLNEKYHAEIRVESKWKENDPNLTEYNPEYNWNPLLYIENSFKEPKQEILYEITNFNDYSYITEIRRLKGEYWERLELHNFPFDLQELSISVTTYRNLNEVKIVADSSRLSCINFDAKNTFIDQQKWRLFRYVKVSENASYDSNNNFKKHSKLVATCYCARKAGYYIFNAYFLIFLLTASSLTIFSVDCKLPQNRLQITYTLLLTSISFKLIINRALPTISYLTSLDVYAIISIFYVCLLCVWHSLVGRFWDKDLAILLDFWSLISFAIVLLVIHLAYLVWLFFAYKSLARLKQKEKTFLIKLKNLNKFDRV